MPSLPPKARTGIRYQICWPWVRWPLNTAARKSICFKVYGMDLPLVLQHVRTENPFWCTNPLPLTCTRQILRRPLSPRCLLVFRPLGTAIFLGAVGRSVLSSQIVSVLFLALSRFRSRHSSHWLFTPGPGKKKAHGREGPAPLFLPYTFTTPTRTR
jgi:hypothetical protein